MGIKAVKIDESYDECCQYILSPYGVQKQNIMYFMTFK